jgi:Fe-S-cluster-containing hydrogenase component 2
MAEKGFIEVNYNICTGCRLCEIACSLAKEGVVNPEASRIKVYQFWPGPLDIPAVCRNCSDHPCVGALSLNGETGAVEVDTEKCLGISCSLCAKACPHELAISFHPQTKKAMICDLCRGDPECVKVCAPECLGFLPKSAFDGKHYAVFPPEVIADSLAFQFYPATREVKGNKEET